jgi:hypothetical protein
MSIEYTYEVVAVNAEAKCMEVAYTASGRQTMHIGTRLPYEGETLEAVIGMYSPVAYWLEMEANVVPPAVGTKGTVKPVVEDCPEPAQEQVFEVGASTVVVANV